MRGSLIRGQGPHPVRGGFLLGFRISTMFQSKPNRKPLAPASPGTSSASEEPVEPQLSPPEGVESSVSTAALDRAMLLAASPSIPSVFSSGPESQTDADVMLRVKAGDRSAFDYL